jgi:hypothetical protein
LDTYFQKKPDLFTFRVFSLLLWSREFEGFNLVFPNRRKEEEDEADEVVNPRSQIVNPGTALVKYSH